MDKYKRYYGSFAFVIATVVLIAGALNVILPKFQQINELKENIASQESKLEQLNDKTRIVQNKIKKIKNSIMSSQKKIYSPIESDLGNDTLFFTLYNDIIEMLHANSIKIRSIDYTYNPETDAFVKFGKDVYFVCDVDMEVVSNYVNLGKLIQDIYQYPYYIKINNIEVKPYQKDKTILITNLSLRLYAHTAPEDAQPVSVGDADAKALKGADLPLPQ